MALLGFDVFVAVLLLVLFAFLFVLLSILHCMSF